ncbi:pre-mRNA-splicing factor [Zygosaccharomyces mellis]|uniref:Pre-mRNA-splicing factor CWC2 n=1 Tax=Zygosaccharomyces mellis TaxID=42258 RepID=A0A4C2E6A1_9SACH|nr:pre-mRNA-splicing factor [Zygosaccharomyces mellis]
MCYTTFVNELDNMAKSWKERSAKVQVKESDLPSSIPPQTGLVFNIWYNKWSQGQGGQSKFISPFKLNPGLHSGKTLGDKQETRFFCLYFAKGMCCLGKKCQYMHHVPENEDVLRLSTKTDVLDCFGREKFAFYRDDMAGVGSFRKRNKTLYVGGISSALGNRPLKPNQIENRIRFLFSELGEIDKLHYLETKNCAFIKFKRQCNAEFAKEAAADQTLLIPSDKEWEDRLQTAGLQVKWAHDDPNPRAKREEEEEKRQETLDLMVHLLDKGNQHRATEEVKKSENEPDKDTDESIFSGDVLNRLRKRRMNLKSENAKEKRQKTEEPPKASLVDYPSSSDNDDNE